MSRHKRVLRAWAVTAQELLPKWFRPDCCIAATALGIDALAHFGIQADPMPVELMTGNAALMDKIKQMKRWPATPAEAERWREETGAWVVCVGVPEPGGFGLKLEPGKWEGHLVLRCRNYITDAATTQAARPEQGIHLPPSLTLQVFDFRQPVVLTLETGTWVRYDPKPRNRGYLSAPDWTTRRAEYRQKFLPTIIDAMKGTL